MQRARLGSFGASLTARWSLSAALQDRWLPTCLARLERSRNSYVVARDGQRFLFANPVHESEPPPVTIVLNWATDHLNEP